MHPVKINGVVVRSLDQDLLSFARMTLDRPLHIRFIEYMPVGGGMSRRAARAVASHGRRMDDRGPRPERRDRGAAAGGRRGRRLGELEPVARDDAPGGWGPATYYRFPGSIGTIGVISPLSHHFCGECNRLRLTADGKLRTCLFSDDELDARRGAAHGTDGGRPRADPGGAGREARVPQHARSARCGACPRSEG